MKLEARNCGVFFVSTEVQASGPSSACCLSRPLSGSWIGSRPDRFWTGAHLGCRCLKWRISPLYHSAGPVCSFLWKAHPLPWCENMRESPSVSSASPLWHLFCHLLAAACFPSHLPGLCFPHNRTMQNGWVTETPLGMCKSMADLIHCSLLWGPYNHWKIFSFNSLWSALSWDPELGARFFLVLFPFLLAYLCLSSQPFERIFFPISLDEKFL